MVRALVPDDLFTRVLRARSRVRDAYDEPLTLASLARTARLSRFHFLRVYTAAFGETPGRDLARVRLSRARELLARGVSVTEVSFAVGFSSLGSFSARFTRESGITPRAFQRAARMVADVPGQLLIVYVPLCFAERFAPAEKIAIFEKSAERLRGTALPARNEGASQAHRTPGEKQ